MEMIRIQEISQEPQAPSQRTVFLIGIGMGNPDTLTIKQKQPWKTSQLLIGAKRITEPFSSLGLPILESFRPDEILGIYSLSHRIPTNCCPVFWGYRLLQRCAPFGGKPTGYSRHGSCIDLRHQLTSLFLFKTQDSLGKRPSYESAWTGNPVVGSRFFPSENLSAHWRHTDCFQPVPAAL